MSLQSILIAESGASKTSWRLCSHTEMLAAYEGKGLNPSAMSAHQLDLEIQKLANHWDVSEIDMLHFYGAGLRFKAATELLQKSLQAYMPTAKIYIEDDLTAAIRSTGRDHGIVAILGTGSNTCLYGGDKILAKKGGHGFLLGDEGSGMDLGKHFLKGLIDATFSPEIQDYVQNQEGKTLAQIRTELYESPHPNRRLAALSVYIKNFRENRKIKDMLLERFEIFLRSTVCQFEEYKENQVDFVGSIAVHYREELFEVCNYLGLKTGVCIQAPIDRLIIYHTHL